MALNGFYGEWFWGWARNTDAAWAYAVNFPSSYIRAYPALQQHFENQGDSQTSAKVNIVEFVQNGSPSHVDWPFAYGGGFTNITFGLYVNRCFAQGVGNIDIFS